MPLTWWPSIVIMLQLNWIVWIRLFLNHIKILCSVFSYRVWDPSNLLKGSLHFLVKDTIIAKWNSAAVLDRQHRALMFISEFFNQLFSDPAVYIRQINTSS